MNDANYTNQMIAKTRVKGNMVSHAMNFHNPEQDKSTSTGKSKVRYYKYYTDTTKLQSKQQMQQIRKYQDIEKQIQNKKALTNKRYKQLLLKTQPQQQPSLDLIIDKFKVDKHLPTIDISGISRAKNQQRSIQQKQQKLDQIGQHYKIFLTKKLEQQRLQFQQNYRNVLKQRKNAKKIVYQDNLNFMNQQLQRLKKGRMKYRQIKSHRIYTQQESMNSNQFNLQSQKICRIFRSNSNRKAIDPSIFKGKDQYKINRTISISKSLASERSLIDLKKINYLQHKGDWQKSNSLFIQKLKKKEGLSPYQKMEGLKNASEAYNQLYKNGKKQAAYSLGLAAVARAQMFLKQIQ